MKKYAKFFFQKKIELSVKKKRKTRKEKGKRNPVVTTYLLRI